MIIRLLRSSRAWTEVVRRGVYYNMKKKTIYAAVTVIVLLGCIAAFFKPLSLSNAVRENDRIIMVLNEFGVRNGEAYIDSVDYQAITTEQFIEQIVGIMGQPDRK